MTIIVDELRLMSDERFHAIYESLTEGGFGPLDGEVARALKFRPHAIKKLPLDQRAKRARTLLERMNNAELTYELFGTYLVRNHQELVADFLDATGVPHEDGMIENNDATPDVAKIGGAVTELEGKHDGEDVTLYLAICSQQWPEVKELESTWRARRG